VGHAKNIACKFKQNSLMDVVHLATTLNALSSCFDLSKQKELHATCFKL